MNVALVANNVGLLWVGVEVATLSTVMMVGIYRTPAAIEAAWKYFILGSVGISLAFFGTILVYLVAQEVIGEGLPAMAWGVSVPVSLAAGAALGVWLMAAPSVLRFGGFAADTHHLAGALAVTVSVLAMAEPLRPGRFLNAPLGLWLLLVPWLPAAGIASPAAWNALASGAALIALSVPRGPIRERYGSWNWIVRWPEFPWAPPAFRRVRTRRGGPA